MEVHRAGRTLEEARKLVEQSFGNYVGSNVMVAAQQELDQIQKEIQLLTSEISDEAIDRKSKNILSKSAYKEMADLQEELRVIMPSYPFLFHSVFIKESRIEILFTFSPHRYET